MTARRDDPVGQPDPGHDLATPAAPSTTLTPEKTERLPSPALGSPDQAVVQINVEEDMPIGGGSSPVQEDASEGGEGPRTRVTLLVVAAVVVAALLALPVAWGLVELLALIGIVGPLIVAWIVVLVVILVATVVLGFRIAQTGL